MSRSVRAFKASLILGAALGFGLSGMAEPAAAEAVACTRPMAPPIPDGATTAFFEMETRSREMQEYLQKMDAYVACLGQEAEAARAEQNKTVNAWNAAVDKFNAR